jgi:NADPH:quinone reductase-like Zn-dependent oxidoreductase
VANKTAKVVRFHTLGGPEVLKIQEEPIPEPGKGEVRLNVKVIGLNRAEVMFRKGEYLESPCCRRSLAMRRPVWWRQSGRT